MLGGGFMRSSKQGVDQLGIYDDGAALDPLTVSHIAGILPAVFHPRWGEGAELKNVWSGIIGMTGDSVPLVGKLDSKWTQRNVKTKDGANAHGEWIAAGFCGEGMVWAWLCGTGLGIMIAGSEDEDVKEAPGRPGGRLANWFPDQLRVSDKRLRSADVANLANQI
jgi:glycine/D-amino acid oxidase-like deaminating enzyme